MRRLQNGFTLIELMITVVVLAVLIAVAAPSFRTMIVNNKSESQGEGILTAIQFTRSEAVKRGQLVSLCASNVAQDACGSDWTNGMLVVTDEADEDSGSVTAGEILKIWEGFSPGANISVERGTSGSKSATSFLRYTPSGMMAQVNNTDVQTVFESYVKECIGEKQRTIRVTLAGMVSTQRAACPEATGS